MNAASLIPRKAVPALLELSKSFPVVAITGPRQAGKSTLAQALFPQKPYVSLEDLDQREFASTDPRGFLKTYEEGAVIDEVQRCPDLLSYLQTHVDRLRRPGLFILTGSAQITLLSAITQSLAGRAGILHLLPFSAVELNESHRLAGSLEEALFKGNYPPVYDRPVAPSTWYSNYIQTYVERDVRQLINVQDLATFQRFVKLCAGRIGQLLNVSSLANDCGISPGTANQWLNVLEATYVIFRLQPHHRNFSKRLVKAPKLFFYDSGLACSLLGITRPTDLAHHALRGCLFESWVISELMKNAFNGGSSPQLYFWRDHKGVEIDALIERGSRLVPIEVKSGATIATNWTDPLQRWAGWAGAAAAPGIVVYGGDQALVRSQVDFVPWNSPQLLINKIYENPTRLE